MSEKSLTLLEVHLGDGDIQIGPLGLDVAPGERADDTGAAGNPEVAGGGDAAGGKDVAEGGDAGGGRLGCGCCSAKSVGVVLLVVGLLAAAAVAAAKLRGGDEEIPPGIAGDA